MMMSLPRFDANLTDSSLDYEAWLTFNLLCSPFDKAKVHCEVVMRINKGMNLRPYGRHLSYHRRRFGRARCTFTVENKPRLATTSPLSVSPTVGENKTPSGDVLCSVLCGV